MDTKKIVMERLGMSKMGKKCRFKDYDNGAVHINVGDEVAMEVKRVTGETSFVVGRYDDKSRMYKVAYDPDMGAGRIKKIVMVYAAS